MVGKTATLVGILILIAASGFCAGSGEACDICTALSCEDAPFEEYWFPAVGNDPSLGLDWEKLGLTQTQRRELQTIEQQWAARRRPGGVQSIAIRPQGSTRDARNQAQEIINNTFKEIGLFASRIRENFEARYMILTHEQKDRLQHLYRDRESMQAKSRVMKEIAAQAIDAGMVLGSRARKRVLCPYTNMEKTPTEKARYTVI